MDLATPHQRIIIDQVVDSCINNQTTLLTGSAGVGKTWCTELIIREVMERYLIKYGRKADVVFSAPTHKACSVFRRMLEDSGSDLDLDIRTTHSFLGLQPVPDNMTGVMKFVAVKNKMQKKDNPTLLVVDECSMISHDMYDFLIKRQIHILFIGDSVQLSPVDDADSTNTSPTFRVHHNFRLTEIVRQAKGNPLIKDANILRQVIDKRKYDGREAYSRISNVNFFKDANEWLNICSSDTLDKTCLSFTNKDVNDLNMALRYIDNGHDDNIPWIMQDELLVVNTGNVDFYTNQIIKVQDPEKIYHEQQDLWYWECKIKGKEIKIVDIESYPSYSKNLDKIKDEALNIVIPKGDGKTGALKQRGQVWKRYYAYQSQYLDVRHKYATTIHKSQSDTVDNVYINLQTTSHDDDMNHRLLYVALTRARKEVFILI